MTMAAMTGIPAEVERNANAVAEVQRIYNDNLTLENENNELRAEVKRRGDRIDFLESKLAESERFKWSYMRKIVELVTCMGAITKLTREAEMLAKTAHDMLPEETEEQAQKEREEARDIVSRLPAADDADKDPHELKWPLTLPKTKL